MRNPEQRIVELSIVYGGTGEHYDLPSNTNEESRVVEKEQPKQEKRLYSPLEYAELGLSIPTYDPGPEDPAEVQRRVDEKYGSGKRKQNRTSNQIEDMIDRAGVSESVASQARRAQSIPYGTYLPDEVIYEAKNGDNSSSNGQ